MWTNGCWCGESSGVANERQCITPTATPTPTPTQPPQSSPPPLTPRTESRRPDGTVVNMLPFHLDSGPLPFHGWSYDPHVLDFMLARGLYTRGAPNRFQKYQERHELIDLILQDETSEWVVLLGWSYGQRTQPLLSLLSSVAINSQRL